MIGVKIVINFNNLNNNIGNCIFVLLLLSTVSYWSSIAFQKLKFLANLGKITTAFSNVGIILILGSRWIYNGYFPLSNLYESLMFLSWGLTSIHLLLEQKINNRIIGGIISPISMFINCFTSISLPIDMQQASPLVPALKSNWLMMHVSIMMISYATLITGSLLAILFLILAKGEDIKLVKNSNNIDFNSNNLKYNKDKNQNILKENSNSITISHRLQGQLTLLESIDNLSYRTIGLGFPMLTVGIIAGAVWANEAWGTYWSWDPKETWALITWLVFASYLHTRITKGWQGKKPAIVASIGFIVVWICYLGVNFLGKGLHSYGWLS
uniref:Cytochrome c biogenesis protein CcsA n=1 Tax=Compsopogon caeruleus TaxID=31354 RepID=A0A1Z1XBA7_9RHOD|nr:cytochrome c biogenesis protein [Compsopogon caeruleus]ARX96153.1 cytochrome c biogenesis protein [Compsopogon caeruleus]